MIEDMDTDVPSKTPIKCPLCGLTQKQDPVKKWTYGKIIKKRSFCIIHIMGRFVGFANCKNCSKGFRKKALSSRYCSDHCNRTLLSSIEGNSRALLNLS